MTTPSEVNAGAIPSEVNAGTIPSEMIVYSIPSVGAARTIPSTRTARTIPLEITAVTIPSVRAARTIPLEITAVTIPLEMSVDMSNLYHISLHIINIDTINIITSEMDASIFYLQEKKQKVYQNKFRTITSLKDYRELMVHTSILTENEIWHTRQKWRRTPMERLRHTVKQTLYYKIK